jgi:hypothetical protein
LNLNPQIPTNLMAMAVSRSQEVVSPNMDWLSMSAIWHP